MNPSSHKSANRPLLWLLTGSVCISFAPIFIKLANVSPESAGFYRMLFAGISLFLLLRLRRAALRLPRRALLLLIAAGLSLGVDFMCWHRSIDYIGPGLSTLLGNLQVFFTACFSCLLFKERIGRNLLFAIVIAIIGLLLITGLEADALTAKARLGILLGFGTALFYSGYILAIKAAMSFEEVSGISAIFISAVSCAAFLALATPATGGSFVIPDLVSLLALLGAGILCSTIGWSFISSAIKQTPATIASLFLLLQPSLAFVWDVLFFARPTMPREALGVVLVLAAIYIGSRKQR